MIRVDEFRRNGTACRDMAARIATRDLHNELLRIADCWDCAAQERLELLWSHPELRMMEPAPPVSALDPRLPAASHR